MSLKKQFLKKQPICKVTFKVPAEVAETAEKVVVVGDFNEWNPVEATEMKQLKNGSFKTTINLETGKEYQFRYLLDNKTWKNDTEADKYVTNEFGGENCVVDATLN